MKHTFLTIALLAAATTAAAQENATVDIHARYTQVVTPVDGQ